MAFWWKRNRDNKDEPSAAPPRTVKKPPKKTGTNAPARRATKGKKGAMPGAKKKRAVVPLEVKVLCMEALDAGMTGKEVAQLATVSPTTLSSWRSTWKTDGVQGLASNLQELVSQGQ